MSDAAVGTGIDRLPTRTGQLLAVVAASVAFGVGAMSGDLGMLGGTFGLLFVALGVVRGSRRAVSVGGFSLFVGVLAGALAGIGAEPLILGTMAAVLAWDFGEQAINVGEQLGREADTRRLEFAHAAASTVVAVVAGGVGYALYLFSAGGQPVTALVFLLIAALALTSALRG